MNKDQRSKSGVIQKLRNAVFSAYLSVLALEHKLDFLSGEMIWQGRREESKGSPCHRTGGGVRGWWLQTGCDPQDPMKAVCEQATA